MTIDVLKVLNFAKDAHWGQKYGDEDYIWHPLRVALNFDNRAMQAIALLHDVLEDTSVTYDEVVSLADTLVADVVKTLTRVEGQSYIEDYIIGQVGPSWNAREVKLADLADNIYHAEHIYTSYASLLPRYYKARDILKNWGR